jgi:hypothetical protein
LKQFQPSALAIIADGGVPALVRRGRLDMRVAFFPVTAATSIMRLNLTLRRRSATRRQVRVRRRFGAQALAPRQRRHGQNDDQTKGNDTNHAWNLKQPMYLGWPFGRRKDYKGAVLNFQFDVPTDFPFERARHKRIGRADNNVK